ncbi:lyase family protein [Burkholderia oklahomensis]|uniref:argininosuccinate lyase n=1 Tax=Burkholderia oklahomensis TaxID=342113 RepID=A0AAI8B6S7_9BURK|nr:lyase family protein [Burkholderia oklahomensis]AIO66606.1 D-ala D-ala ligase family protein [Burkholderia oklahomensis]AOI41981.1 argininosuccinate lyase [Burkholderia oklahomensis EO147]KUY50688.1 argininosuccinate lyase [Burkholderia oklahomensis EO147]QPS36723.1 ATP-grasp domain-containing protein [Burkholderia oklahomensis]
MTGIFVFIESNTTGTGELLVRKALQRGLTPYFLTADRGKYPFLDAVRVVTVSIDTSDADGIHDFVSSLGGVVGVLSSSEYFIEVASEVARRLGLPTANTEATRICRDKKRLADALAEHGLDAPRTRALSLDTDAPPALDGLAYPVVVKPRTGSGSVGVRLCANAEEAGEHCAALYRAGTHAALVQTYVEGDEYSVETLTVEHETQIVGIVRKRLGREPHFVEIGHDYPAPLSSGQRERIERTVLRALEAVGYAFGPAHTELRVRGDTATIIEINPRLAGGLIPVLLGEVFGVDLLDHVLDMWLGVAAFPDLTAKRYGAIRFALPAREGVLKSPLAIPADIAATPELRYFHPIARPGDALRLEGSFRDRIAAVVCAGDHRESVEAVAERAVAELQADIDADAPVPVPAAAPNATPPGLPARLQAIVYGDGASEAPLADLDYLFDLNEAHLVMLGATRIVALDRIRPLLDAHRRLRRAGYEPLLARPKPRGLYMLVENYLIETLGEDVGGVLQTGRSRNDINAATTKLHLRDATSRAFDALWRLRRAIVFRASANVERAFPIYSQYQPALPGTLAHQLLAYDDALANEIHALFALFQHIDVCPLGAGAGGGTTLPIDPELVCRLLGFEQPASNSLDAVANRSGVVHFLSAMNAIGLVLSRLAQDLQMWTTAEFALVSLPAALTGGSSMLPQKKNPFLVEFVKSRAGVPLGALASCSATLGKTPYTNSFEAGSPMNGLITQACAAIEEAAAVGALLIDGLEAADARIDTHLKDAGVVAMAVAESLVVRRSLDFRSAHTQVAQAVRDSLAHGRSSYDALVALDPDFVSRSPLHWARSHRFGGGPGAADLNHGVARACRALADDEAAFRRRQDVWREAEQMRRLAVEQLAGD